MTGAAGSPTPRTGAAQRRVLVTDGGERSVVGTVRSLAADGWSVGVAAVRGPAAAQWSRHCSRRFRVPDPFADAVAFVEALGAAAREVGYDVVLTGSDAGLLALSAHRDRLGEGVRHGLPPHDVVVACLDKRRLAEASAAGGLPTPRTVLCADVDEARRAAGDLGLPVIVKPVQTVFLSGTGLRQQGGRRADDDDELAALVEVCGSPCLVQAAEPGTLVSCSGLMLDGRLQAVATSRYERTWPPKGGSAAFARTIEPPPELAERAEALLAGLGWEGIFELEVIAHPDGRFLPIDLNPRPFGSISLVVAAGVPLPALWCNALMGDPVPPTRVRPGVGYRWEDGDLKHALWQLRRRRIRAAGAALAPRRTIVHAHFRGADPLPLAARAVYLGLSRLTPR